MHYRVHAWTFADLPVVRRLLNGSRMKLAYATPLLLAAGCTVMVNGKPRRIGGGDPDPQPQAQAQPQAQPQGQAPARTTTASREGTPAPTAPPPAPAAQPGATIKLPGVLTATPIVTTIENVAFDTTYGKQHGHSNSPDCGSDMSSTPIASIVLDRPVASMHVAVVGGSNDGFVLKKGGALWHACTYSIGQVPVISGLQEGWQPGRYDIHPLSRYGRGAKTTFSVEVFDPKTPAVWGDDLPKVAITGKLEKPKFVEVAIKPTRRKLRAAHAGWGCEKVALPDVPDLALVLERPVPGLVVRPLPTVEPVTVRRELQGAKEQNKGCPTYERRVSSSDYTPSYHSPSELHFDRDDEGTYGLSLGTTAERPFTVTLMIYDASTKLEKLEQYPYGGDLTKLEHRWLGYHFPQLDVRELGSTGSYARAELTAKLFATAPRLAFVYPRLDLDKDIAHGGTDVFPKKHEPLLVTEVGEQSVGVLTVDGVRFSVKRSHLVLAPEGELAIPAAPRALGKLEIGAVMSMLPPSGKPLVDAREKRLAAYDKCVDRVWAPYGRQLPSITRPAGVDIVVYESARTKNIRAAGEAAVDRACGTDAKLAKLTEAERVKMLAVVEKARAELLAVATARLRAPN